MATRAPRKTFKEVISDNRNALDYLAALSGKPQLPISELQAWAMKPKRARSAPDPRVVHEKDVLKAVLHYLRAHPKVCEVQRNQSGVFVEGNRRIRVGFVGKLDVSFVLKSSNAYCEIEVKSPTGAATEAQIARVAKLRAQGILTGIVRSVDDMAALLKTAL